MSISFKDCEYCFEEKNKYWISRRIVYLKELIRTKRVLMEVKE